jgi:hypothetical protein
MGIFSRSLMLQLGISSSLGSTFLPPGLIECFQSYTLGTGPAILGEDGIDAVHYTLLSRWKQIPATLLRSTYVVNAFSQFDSRTINIERALTGLDLLLATYALPSEAGQGHNDSTICGTYSS